MGNSHYTGEVKHVNVISNRHSSLVTIFAYCIILRAVFCYKIYFSSHICYNLKKMKKIFEKIVCSKNS